MFKTPHQLMPRFISNIFEVKSSHRPARSQQNLNLKVIRANRGLKIWDRLPAPTKNAEKLFAVKRLIKTWDGILCKSNLC